MKVVSLDSAKAVEGAGVGGDHVDIHDRVAEAYFGKLGTQFMRETQLRIHWICGKVLGNRVLDVGCSQGIGSILLGREGKEVTAVDTAQRSIEQALAYLEDEAPRVRENVSFINADFLTHPFGKEVFDTVIIAEVLEHLLLPERFIDAAAERLAEGGRLVVTVPFGINDFIDHKHTYYLLEPYRLLSRHFEVLEVAMLGKWLGLVGRRRSTKEAVPAADSLDIELIQRLEASFQALEREIREETTTARTRLNEANLKYRTATEQIATLKQRVAQEEQAHQQGEGALAKLQQQLTQAEQARDKTRSDLNDANLKYRSATEQIATLKQRVAEEEQARQRSGAEAALLQTRIAEMAKARETLEQDQTRLTVQLALAERETEHLSAQLAAAEQRHESERQQGRAEIERLQSLLEAQRTARHEAEKTTASLSVQIALAEQSAAQMMSHLAATEQRLETEQQARRAEVAQLEADLEGQRESRHQVEMRVVRLEAEHGTVTARLDEANLKYRAATEQVATLKQRLQDAQSANHAHEAELAALQEQLATADSARMQLSQEREAVELRLNGEMVRLSGQLDEILGVRDQLESRLSQALSELEEEGGRAAALDGELVTTCTERDAAALEAAAVQKELEAANESLHAVQAQLGAAESLFDQEKAALTAQAADLQVERDSLAERLADANSKYRSSTEQYAALRDDLSDARTRQEQSARAIAELEEGLAAARRDRDDSRGELDRTASELETTRALRRGDQNENEQLKRQMLQSKKALADLQGKMEALRQQKIGAENQVAKTRAMLSFQLGYHLLHGFKSFRAFTQLPGQLLALRQEAKRRRAARKVTKDLHQHSSAPAAWKPKAVSAALIAPAALSPASLSLPDSGFAQALKTLRVACIMDEFTFSSYQPECNLLQLSVQHWRSELENFTPELLFIESAWRGKDEQWGSKVGHMSEEVVGIVDWCRKRKIPTVFWNKEDPVHFETFLSTAKMFDYVFTTDIDCIHRYKAALGHDRVHLLPFACQPAASNPIEKYERKDAFCFAGAYYVRYPERTRDLGNFMTSLSEFRPVEIYDRNYGKNDPNYQFPPEYQPFIVGNLPFDQIDKAYKGYRYAINLNSIKQSQSMFARRVFELLASNTITVSNFSRGVRLLFGDLVVTTDDGAEIVRKLEKLGGDDVQVRKFRLAGLRKVMMNHTYQDRLAYVVSKAQGKPAPNLLPSVVVTAYAKNQEQFDALLASFGRQSHRTSRLVVVVPSNFIPVSTPDNGRVHVFPANSIDNVTLGELTGGVEFVAGMVPDDYYGPNYLIDLVLATRYSEAEAVGKFSHHVWSQTTGLGTAYPGCQYKAVNTLPARCSLIRPRAMSDVSLRDWVTSLHTRSIESGNLLAIDEFNYCKNGNESGFGTEQAAAVNDLAGLDLGITVEELTTRSERIAPEVAAPDEAPVLGGADLAAYFKVPANKGYTLTVSGPGWEVESSLADGKHEYLYAATDVRPADLGFETHARFHLDTTPGLNLQLVLLFLDAQKQRISHVVKSANRNQDAEIPAGTEWIRLGLRIYGGGAARINGLVLGHRPLRPAEVLGRAEHLVLTNHYPSYDDLYRNGFVHSRVKAYADRGVHVDVFRLRTNEALSYHEFHDVDVITGSQEALHKLLSGGHYKSILVHFLDEAMWQVLQHHVDKIEVFVWVHGAEIQPWHRRDYNFANEEERNAAKVQSEIRMNFWRGLLKDIPKNLKLIFVSNYFAEEVMEDVGFRLPVDSYHVIHNPIDTDLFAYHPKTVEQRKKILSIRPYASRKYANDLSVQAILALSKKPYFNELEFRLIGDGKLFDEVLEPVRQFSNVLIERRFLSQPEIAALHQQYGIFLCPTRMDAQGVSRDEAMSSGLIPVTNAVTAIPEFVDDKSGILAPGEDAVAMAEGIDRVYGDPALFSSLTSGAAERVRRQSAKDVLIKAELDLFHKE